jgi:hypothetical protein
MMCGAIVPRQSYNRAMARGWESKFVEAQQDEAARQTTSPQPHRARAETEYIRRKESLRLALQSVRQQLERSCDERHRRMLERAAADLEKQIEQLSC